MDESLWNWSLNRHTSNSWYTYIFVVDIWYHRNKTTSQILHKRGKIPTTWGKMPTFCPRYIAPSQRLILSWIIIYNDSNSIFLILDNTVVKFNHTAERCLCDTYHFMQISDMYYWQMCCMFETKNHTCTLSLTSIYNQMQMIPTINYCIFAVNISYRASKV